MRNPNFRDIIFFFLWCLICLNVNTWRTICSEKPGWNMKRGFPFRIYCAPFEAHLFWIIKLVRFFFFPFPGKKLAIFPPKTYQNSPKCEIRKQHLYTQKHNKGATILPTDNDNAFICRCFCHIWLLEIALPFIRVDLSISCCWLALILCTVLSKKFSHDILLSGFKLVDIITINLLGKA